MKAGYDPIGIEEFDNYARAGSFIDGPHISTFGEHEGDQYCPVKTVWGDAERREKSDSGEKAMTEQIGPGQGCGECGEHYGEHTQTCSRRQPNDLDAIAALIPATFYADRPLVERVRRLVEDRRTLTRLQQERDA